MSQDQGSRFEPGTRIDEHYTIERFIARGSVSEIYRARADTSGDVVALKVLLDATGTESPERRIAYFLREAAVTAQVHHPNVVELLEVGFDPRVGHYMALEYLPGGNLEEIISEHGPLDEYPARDIACQVLGALSAAHRMGVVHRDLKPNNIQLMETEEGFIAKLFDFGIATLFDESPAMQSLTEVNTLVGTPAWMSPEQCRGHELDERSDLYAVGALLYYLLTGQAPFPPGHVLKVLNAVLSDMPRSVADIRKELGKSPLSRSIQKAVQRALQKDPNQRFVDAAHFQAFLDRDTPSIQWNTVPTGLIVGRAPTDSPGLIAVRADRQYFAEAKASLAVTVEDTLAGLDHDVVMTLDHDRASVSLLVHPGPTPSVSVSETAATALRLYDRICGQLENVTVRMLVGVGDPTLGFGRDPRSHALLTDHLHDVIADPVYWSGEASVTASGTFRLTGLGSLTGGGVYVTPEWVHELRADFDVARLLSGLHSLGRVLAIRDPSAEPHRSAAADLVLESLCGQHHGMDVNDLEAALYLSADPIEVLSGISDLQSENLVRIDSTGLAHVVPLVDETFPHTHLPPSERRLLGLRIFSLLARRRPPDRSPAQLVENLETGHRLSAVRYWRALSRGADLANAERCLYRALRLLAVRTPSPHIRPLLEELAAVRRAAREDLVGGVSAAVAPPKTE